MNRNRARSAVLFRYGLLAVCLGFLILWVFGKSLPLPYLSDDFEHAQLVAEIRAGLRPWRDLLGRPFHGQLLVLLRLLFWFGTRAGHMSMAWVRAGVLAAHGCAAFGVGLLCLRWTRSGAAGCFAATLYACAAGFSGDIVSWPSSSIFCFGAAAYIWALVALTSERLGPIPKLILSDIALIVAFLGMNAEIVAAAGLCIYCWIAMPAQRLWRTWAPIVYMLTAMALGAIWGHAASSEKLASFALTPRGAVLGAWLVFTAPLRFVVSWTGWTPDFAAVLSWAGFALLPLLATLWFLPSRQRGILLVAWTPAVWLAFLTGFSRASLSGNIRYGPGFLYVSDRYYYCFLFPLAITAAFLSAEALRRFPVRRPATVLLMVTLLLAAVFESRQRYLHGIPYPNYEMVRQALGRGKLLLPEIEEYLRQRPQGRVLTLRDGLLPLDGARFNAVTLAFLIYSERPNGIQGVHFTKTELSGDDAAAENSILDHWAAAAGFSGPVAHLDKGMVISTHLGENIDFGQDSFEEALIAGFSWWDKPFRWVTGDASVRLRCASGALVITAYAPIDQLRGKFPHLDAIGVAVDLDGLEVGHFSIGQTGLLQYRIVNPRSRAQPGSLSVVTLRPDFIWHARDLVPGSFDDRDLSFALEAIGFEGK